MLPHGAGVILREPDGRVLFLRRADDACDYPDLWCWPGGSIEPGEDAETAARRELNEETGIRFHGPLVQVDDRDGFITYLGDVAKETEPRLNDEHQDAHWTEPWDLRLIGGKGGKNIHPGVLATLGLGIGYLDKDRSMATDKKRLAFDKASVRSYDADGRMRVELTPISKANVCPYKGDEIPNYEALGLDGSKVYRLLRDPQELEKAAKTANGVPLLIVHKPTSADDHPRELTVGATGTDAIWDAPYLKNSLSIWDGEGIAGIESEEQKELSSAYHYVADMTPGDYEGESYDGVMREIEFNHVALVVEGRAGPDVLVMDAKPKEFQAMIKTTKLPSRKAMLVQGAVAGVLIPKLAQDAKVDLGPVFKGVTAKNYGKQRATILKGIETATKGKLAQDMDLEDVMPLLDAMCEVGAPGDPDDFDNEFEEDKVTVDADLVPGAGDNPDPQDTNKGAEDGDDDESKKERLKAAGFDDEAIGKIMAAISAPAAPEATDEDPPFIKKDKEEDDDKPMTKGAMDAAIAAATKRATELTMARMRAVSEARDAVKPHVGEVVISMDSAEAIYRMALDAADIDYPKDLNLPALKAMVAMLPKPDAARVAQPYAMDSKAQTDLTKRFPGADRIRTI